MNEEQLKKIAILAKELGFKPVTYSTKRAFVELTEDERLAGYLEMANYLLLCEIQLWINNTHNLCVSSQFFRSNPEGDSGTIGYFYTIVNRDIEDISMFLEKYENLLLDCEQDEPGNHIDQEKFNRLMFEDKICFKTVQEALATGILESLKQLKMKVLYRYTRGFRDCVDVWEYNVLRETVKCYVIKDPYTGKDRFVRKEGKKKFAHNSKKEALLGFIKRTERCLDYLKADTERARNYLLTAKYKYENN